MFLHLSVILFKGWGGGRGGCGGDVFTGNNDQHLVGSASLREGSAYRGGKGMVSTSYGGWVGWAHPLPRN